MLLQIRASRRDLTDAKGQVESLMELVSGLQSQLQLPEGAPIPAVVPALTKLQNTLADKTRQLKETETKLASWRTTAGESSGERDQALKQCSDLRRAITAAEATVAKLTSDLSEQSASRANAEKDAEGAHAEAAQRKQVDCRDSLACTLDKKRPENSLSQPVSQSTHLRADLQCC